MRLVPIHQEEAKKMPWVGTVLHIIAGLAIIGGIYQGMIVEGILVAVFIFALTAILDRVHEIACNTRGYYIIKDDAKPEETKPEQQETHMFF